MAAPAKAGAKAVGKGLGKKVGPLPLWGWAIVAVSAILVGRYIKNRMASTSTALTSAPASTTGSPLDSTGSTGGGTGGGTSTDPNAGIAPAPIYIFAGGTSPAGADTSGTGASSFLTPDLTTALSPAAQAVANPTAVSPNVWYDASGNPQTGYDPTPGSLHSRYGPGFDANGNPLNVWYDANGNPQTGYDPTPGSPHSFGYTTPPPPAPPAQVGSPSSQTGAQSSGSGMTSQGPLAGLGPIYTPSPGSGDPSVQTGADQVAASVTGPIFMDTYTPGAPSNQNYAGTLSPSGPPVQVPYQQVSHAAPAGTHSSSAGSSGAAAVQLGQTKKNYQAAKQL